MPNKVQLSGDLEQSLVSAILRGVAPAGVVDPAELSKPGRLVLAALSHLGNPPFDLRAVYLATTDALGGDRAELKHYLALVNAANVDTSIGDILRIVREKQLLVQLINEAGTQLRDGKLNAGAIVDLVTTTRGDTVRGLMSLADTIGDGLPEPPQGLDVRSLPRVTELTGGIYGLWCFSGEPGCGKTTLAWQIALDVGSGQTGIPVVYYDTENGTRVLAHHTAVIFNNDLPRIREATKRIFVRDSISSLDMDLAQVPAPALVVIDSIQKLPVNSQHELSGLNRWVHRGEALKKRGYHVLMISEIPKSKYEAEPHIGDFKGSGEIEYSADMGARLVPIEGTSRSEFWIVKNRHRPEKGFAAVLERQNSWLWRERN